MRPGNAAASAARAPEEFMSVGGGGADARGMSAEERGRHNFERMLSALFARPARVRAQAG